MEETIERIQQQFGIECDRAKEIFDEVKRQKRIVAQRIFDKFDKYSCIKNDKWYKEFKNEELGEE